MKSRNMVRRLNKIKNLNFNEQKGLKNIIGELTKKFPSIRSVILYGSKARGDFVEDSDIDLIFVLGRNITRSTKLLMYDIIYTHEVLNDITVSAIFVSESDFNNKISTLLMKVRKEGIQLWSRK